MLQSRPLAFEDLDAAARLLVEAYPHRADEPVSWQRTAWREQTQQWGLFDRSDRLSDRLVAYAALWRIEGGKFRFDVIVTPRHRRRGYGGSLFEIVFRQAEHRGVDTLQARAYGTAADSLSFLGRRHFTETMRMRGFVLMLAGIDVASLAAACNSCLAPDVSIAIVSPSKYNDAQFWNKLAALHDAAREGWPDPDPGGPTTSTDPESLRRMLLPSFESVIAFQVALCGDELVGYSLLNRRRDSGEAQFASTAVKPSMRGRHVATALRACCILKARESGFAAVRSASGNAALIRINARFGFQETYAEVRLVRRLG